jgi:hypothetical protein
MPDPSSAESEFVRVAEVEIESVVPGRSGFTLVGQGRDKADYRLEMALDMPLDDRTRAVLGELLSQSEWTVSRRVRPPLKAETHPRTPSRRAQA